MKKMSLLTLLVVSTLTHAGDIDGSAVFGSALGAAAGSAIGSAAGGTQGAIIGGGAGGAIGAAMGSKNTGVQSQSRVVTQERVVTRDRVIYVDDRRDDRGYRGHHKEKRHHRNDGYRRD